MEEKQDRRSCRTRIAIRQSYLTLLEEMPPERISVSALCRLANINRSTFYQHYDDVYALRDCLLQDMVEDFDQLILHIESCHVPSLESTRLILEYIRANCRLLGAFVVDRYDLPYHENMAEKSRKLFESQMLAANPQLRFASRDRIENTVLFLTYGFFAIYRRWILNDCQENIDSLAETATLLATRCLKDLNFPE